MSITPVEPTDQTYTITQAALSYTHPDFTADPSYCPITYSYAIEDLNNGGTPITNSGKDFTIQYSADLTPIAEGPLTVTITATSTSKYTTSETPVTASADFDTTFLNPCLDTNFVDI